MIQSYEILQNLILNGKINIQDIERNARIDFPSIYVLSFRAQRQNPLKYKEILEVLKDDIQHGIFEDEKQKKRLTILYDDSLFSAINNHEFTEHFP